MRYFRCANGNEFATMRRSPVPTTVDELISFLQPHKGKIFSYYGLYAPCFVITDSKVVCKTIMDWEAAEEDINHAMSVVHWFAGKKRYGGDGSDL